MKRYKNFVMLEQMKECIRSGQQAEALEIADTLDAHQIKNYSDVNLMADLYMENSDYNKAYACLRELYQRRKTRSVLMQLINLSVRMKNVNAAEKYFADFKAISGGDFYNYIFRYNIDKLEGKSLEVQIDSLEKLRAAEPIDVWAYELAKLYHKAGMGDKCVKECDDIEIWFGDGVYVDRARALRAYYKGELNINEISSSAKQHKTEQKSPIEAEQKPTVQAENRHENQYIEEIKSDDPAETGEQEEKLRLYEPAGRTKETEQSGASDMPESTGEEEISGENAVSDPYENAGMSERPEQSADPGMPESDGMAAISEETTVSGPAESAGMTEISEENTVSGPTESAGMTEISEENTVSGPAESMEMAEISEQNAVSDQPESMGMTGKTDQTADPGLLKSEGMQELSEQDEASDMTESAGQKEGTEQTVSSDPGESAGMTGTSGHTGRNNRFIEVEEDDFAEEIRDYEEEVVAENTDIDIGSELIEGEAAIISSFLEKEESELGKVVRVELQREQAAERRWRAASEQAMKQKQAERTEEKPEEKPEENSEGKFEEKTEEGSETKSKSVGGSGTKQEEPDADNAVIETVRFDFASKPGKEIEKGSFLDAFLTGKGKSLEDYFEFYAYQSEVRSQLIKTLEILLNPQIKNMCLVVTGTDEKEKDLIIRGIAKILYGKGFLNKTSLLASNGSKLNAQQLHTKESQLPGACLVIRYAGKMTKETAQALLELDEKLAGKTAVVLTDTRSEISTLFRDNRELNSMFPQRIHIPEFDEKDIEELLYYKINDSGYLLAQETQPELKRLIREYCRSGSDPVSKCGNLIAKAIDRVDTRNAQIFLSRSDKSGFKENNIIRLSDIMPDGDD